jgi:hypothetical protein
MLLPAPLTEPRVAAHAIPVRYLEGVTHGFLVVRTLNGDIIGDGDLAQTVRGTVVTNHLSLHFTDGSSYDDRTSFSQNRVFRLLQDHLVQKGPSFKQPLDITTNASTGQVTVRYTDKDGKEKADSERLRLPADIANGMVFTLIKNIDPKAPQMTASMVVATPKPRLLKLEIAKANEESFTVGKSTRTATVYDVKMRLEGAAGVVAGISGKQPPDTHLWVVTAEAPVTVKSEGPLQDDGPIWRIELVGPGWPEETSSRRADPPK